PLIYRNDLLAAEIYPDSDDFENSSGILENGLDGIADRVEFLYNRAGELIEKRDQNGTVHEYEYDDLGRLLHDRVTTLGNTVDGSVRRISTEYTVTGQKKSITSYNNAIVETGSIVNQVFYEYDENGRLSREYTAHEGAVDVHITPFIGYEYDTIENGLRLKTQVYPSGKRIGYEYDEYGHIESLLDDNNVLVEYDCSGSGSALRTTYVEPGLTLDYTVSGALDRFGRIASHAWKNSLGAALVNIEHGYDRAGNRLYRNDLLQAANSELYTYDGVNQIKSLNRGALNNNKTAVVSVNHSEAWNFDETGNWVQYNKNSIVENRSHNAANEIQSLVSHDANGNMTVMTGLNCKYDAWNRLVQVSDTSDNLIACYEYNGLNQRIKKIVGSVETKSFFNEDWQELESVKEAGDSAPELTAYVWGLRYIDDLILREKGAERLYSVADPNWNVVAIVEDTGSIVERMKYDAFGKVAWIDAVFGAKANSDYAWSRTFTGQVRDSETGLMLYRNRYYNTSLGRFVQRDPVGYEARDASLYRYIFSNPCSHTDERGTNPAGAAAIGAGVGCFLGGCLTGVRAWWRNENRCQIACKSLGGCIAGAITGTVIGLNISTGDVRLGASCAASAVSTLISNELDNICDGICGKPTAMPWGCAFGGAVAKLVAGCIASWAKSAKQPFEQVMLTFFGQIAGHDVAQGCTFFKT
ncbi:MAG: hypothetical protein FWE67_08250, partial [Planctomycetaceae bacterium]|nr:hypothetical protein [Planctomycetaceae bacterium]